MFFEVEISYAVSEVNKRLELRKFLRMEEEVKLKSIYNFMSKFESEQFINFVFSILNANSKKRPSKPSILILDCPHVGTLFSRPGQKPAVRRIPALQARNFDLTGKRMVVVCKKYWSALE